MQRVIDRDTIIHRAYTALNQFNWTQNEFATYKVVKRIHMDNTELFAA
ncbi:MAG: hypothetical protein ACH349_00400 [Candidatus Rhabdochlamydia sp.]